MRQTLISLSLLCIGAQATMSPVASATGEPANHLLQADPYTPEVKQFD